MADATGGDPKQGGKSARWWRPPGDAPAVPSGSSGSFGSSGTKVTPPEPLHGSRLGASTLILTVLMSAVLAGGAGGVVGYRFAEQNSSRVAASPPPSGPGERLRTGVAGIASRVSPSVVQIQVRTAGGEATGSGFVVRSDGYVITNNHVVGLGAQGGDIEVVFQNRRRFPARIVGRSQTYDLAVVKVDESGLPPAELGNSDSVAVGDVAVAIGSPLGLAGTVTAGIVSAKDRAVTVGDRGVADSFISALQTDAAISLGNSGGPLVDSGGRVVGVNSAIAIPGNSAVDVPVPGSVGVGFAIPINHARRIVEQLIDGGVATYPFIGVRPDSTYRGDGVRIGMDESEGSESITPNGPADQAGLLPGDIILTVGDREVDSPGELIVAVRAYNPGEMVDITYNRNGGEQRTRVALSQKEEIPS